MSWRFQLRSLPLRTKLLITVAGAGVAVLGLSTYLSFQYWQDEARSVAEQQALLAATSTRVTVESALNRGDAATAQKTLTRLLQNPSIRSARIYDANSNIIYSARPHEVGSALGTVFIPRANELPSEGIAKQMETSADHGVHAFVPVGSSMQDVLEIEFSLTSVQKAMERGARLGAGLLVASLLILSGILWAMLQREVVKPLNAAVKEVATLKQQLEDRAGFAEVGELAAEMAHEFKRPLAAIQTAMQLLEQEYTLGADGQRLLSGIEGQLDRLSDTMRDVFGLAKPISVQREDMNLVEVLNNALFQLAATNATSKVSVRREYGSEEIIVRGDAKRLETAFLNLMANAVEAMPSGGALTVRVEKLHQAIDVLVMDTGSGLDADEVEKMMKPFYSTKPTGTGLGLPLVARIIAAHDGKLSINSEKGVGTKIHIRLPLEVNQDAAEAQWALQES